MSFLPRAFLAVGALTLPGVGMGAYAQAPASGPLRLGTLYRELDARSPRLRAASASARAAAARIGPVSRLPDPSLQLATMNRELPGFALNDPLGMNEIQLMQMVPLGGRIGLAADAAKAQSRAAAARIPEITLAERVAVARQFYGLFRLDRAILIAEENRDLIRRLHRSAEAMYAVGTGRQADVLRAQVEVARMTEDILRMQAMRAAEAARLNGMLDRPATEPVSSPVLPRLDVTLPGTDTLVALALAGRPMLRAAAEEVVAAETRERRAAREIWPDLNLGVIYGQRGMPEGGTDRMISFMVGATLPIWAGSRQKQMKLEAVAMREMAQADLAAMQAETRTRVVEIVAELDRVERLTTLYTGTVLPQSRTTVASSLSAYQVGAVDFMTVLDNQMTLNRYHQELIALTAERGTMLAELEMLTGRSWVDPESVTVTESGGAE
jgi:outer membrane protein TolC